jgi:hypothetical protein
MRNAQSSKRISSRLILRKDFGAVADKAGGHVVHEYAGEEAGVKVGAEAKRVAEKAPVSWRCLNVEPDEDGPLCHASAV